MNLLVKAIAVANEAHKDKKTLSGRPYILHPLHLMLQMDSEEEMITAVLHDVVEDSIVNLEDLQAMGFPPRVLDALALLTHDKEELSYEKYILAIKSNPLAVRVKLADLTHNMDVRRIPTPLSQGELRRLGKYQRAWLLLDNS